MMVWRVVCLGMVVGQVGPNCYNYLLMQEDKGIKILQEQFDEVNFLTFPFILIDIYR